MVRDSLNIEVGLLTGEQKRALECYVDARCFRQRKSYDEYYVDTDPVAISLRLQDLYVLAEEFTIEVGPDAVYLRST